MRRLLFLLLLAGCTPPASPTAHAPATQRWVAVLVAGDSSLPVFDGATARMASLLTAAGTPAAEIHALSASPDVLAEPHVQVASRARVLEAVAALHPAPGQACLVFMTSHGAQHRGLYLAPRDEYLTPADLADALAEGCGAAPTVAVVSGCYTGAFATPPVAAPNRVVLTAARADRASFGCGAGRSLTFYDACLLDALATPPPGWQGVVSAVNDCVAREEAADRERPSEPQAALGAATAALPVLGR